MDHYEFAGTKFRHMSYLRTAQKVVLQPKVHQAFHPLNDNGEAAWPILAHSTEQKRAPRQHVVLSVPTIVPFTTKRWKPTEWETTVSKTTLSSELVLVSQARYCNNPGLHSCMHWDWMQLLGLFGPTSQPPKSSANEQTETHSLWRSDNHADTS